jgi:hypothetical protein
VSAGPIDLDQVRAEIAEEVRRERAGGSFDAARERELERLFHQYAPMQGRTGALTETLRGVDAGAFIDPYIPIASDRAGGAAVKKAILRGGLWYGRWLAEQTTRGLSAVARSLHLIDDQLIDLRQRVELAAVTGTPVIELAGAPDQRSWWAEAAVGCLREAGGRVLVSACGDGALVRALRAEGVDGYGIDPRQERIRTAEVAGLDLRDEDLLEHLSSVSTARLSGILLTGTTEAMLPAQRRRLLGALDDVMAPGARIVIHALHPDAVDGDLVPAELDLAGGRPLRPQSWSTLLEAKGYEVERVGGPDGRDFLVLAVRRPRSAP